MILHALLFLAGCTCEPKVPEGRPNIPSRAAFNQAAVRVNVPVFWAEDRDGDLSVDPDEVVSLRFYPTAPVWTQGGVFTPAFDEAVGTMAAALVRVEGVEDLILDDLDAGRPTLVRTDLRTASDTDRAFAALMLEVAAQIDTLYERQLGLPALQPLVATRPVSHQSLLRRNRDSRCASSALQRVPACNIVAPGVKPKVDVWPSSVQEKEGFCAALEGRPDAKALLNPFTVVREGPDGSLRAEPYHTAYSVEVQAIAATLRKAADLMRGVPTEAALTTYLDAAASAFGSDNWQPADEAWAAMNPHNSSWYVRVAPDEVYWDPCAQKAAYHLTFARINRGSLVWQERLTPLLPALEAAMAEAAGPPYTARTVSFHLPDFIDIVLNAGDDRDPLGATVGQSLPNWGPVAEEARGRTVVMTNLYRDPDSLAGRRASAASLLDAAALGLYSDEAEPGLVATILHEAAHNLGPAAEYRVNGKTDTEIFGGQLAAMLEELKAQSAAWALADVLETRGVLTEEFVQKLWIDNLVWALGQVSEGMLTSDGARNTYPQLAAVQLGLLMEFGALTWEPKGPAANGEDLGVFVVHPDKLEPAVHQMMKQVAGIMARGDRAAAEAMAARFVGEGIVPHAVIAERWGRTPQANMVYALEL